MQVIGIILIVTLIISLCKSTPVIVSTWDYTNATSAGWSSVESGDSALDAAEFACSVCEFLQCRGSVGFGGHPDEGGETTLDAMIMDGTTMNVGAVGGLRRIKRAVSVARRVLENTRHSLLVGDAATQFAVSLGFKEESLQTKQSMLEWQKWRHDRCQPNFWMNVVPNPSTSCGPYIAKKMNNKQRIDTLMSDVNENNHDTIGVVVVDKRQRIAAATSTNGLRHKIAGRVGDSPIAGAGAYADNEVGAAAATGDGDILMRFLPSFLAVERMRMGESPQEAAVSSLQRILQFYPNTQGGVVAVNKLGEHGAACIGMTRFPYTVQYADMKEPIILYVYCINSKVN